MALRAHPKGCLLFRHVLGGGMRVIGLTGGMGMGKSTVARAFRRAAMPVFDADAAVHRLQAPDGVALAAIAAAFPGVVGTDAAGRRRLSREALRARALAEPAALARLEAIMHPLVAREVRAFLARHRRAGAPVAVLDVPLLLEMGAAGRVDRVVAVSAPPSVQRARLARRRLGAEQIDAFLARQIGDAEIRRRAHLVVPTGLSRHHALRVVARLIEELRRWTVPCCSTPRPPASIRWRATASSRWRLSNW